VELAREGMARLTLWLDCNSDFFGAYHDIPAQAAGQIVVPKLQ
jgi:hypothetical protein